MGEIRKKTHGPKSCCFFLILIEKIHHQKHSFQLQKIMKIIVLRCLFQKLKIIVKSTSLTTLFKSALFLKNVDY